jgi:hypothetical protein
LVFYLVNFVEKVATVSHIILIISTILFVFCLCLGMVQDKVGNVFKLCRKPTGLFALVSCLFFTFTPDKTSLYAGAGQYVAIDQLELDETGRKLKQYLDMKLTEELADDTNR